MDDDTEMPNTEPIPPHLEHQNMELEAAKQNPVDETMTSPPPLVDDNNVDEMVTEDSGVPANHVLQQDTVNVVHLSSKDVELQQSVENDPVDNTQDTELHSHPSIEEPSIDLKCQSNDIDHHNTQQQTPIQNGSAAANFEEEDATTTNSTHGNIETTGGSNHLNSGTPPETTSNDNDDNTGEGATPKDVDSETDTCSDSEEFQDHVSTPRLDTINENNSNAYLEENKDAESKLVLVTMNKEQALTPKSDVGSLPDTKSSNNSFLLDPHAAVGDESGTEEDQALFMKELETFFKERSMDFKPPKFYGEGLNLLKLWRAVIRLGGYEQVTSCKLWRQVGESFKPPKTCTTVSWTFRCFYEKALLEYEKHEMHGDELSPPDASLAAPSSIGNQAVGSQGLGSGRARRDAAARAMQGWHSQRLLGNGEVGDPIIKDKSSISTLKREKQLKSIGLLKRKPPSPVERAVKVARMKAIKPQLDTMVVDAGPPADWVKINVRRTKDCFEVYALVPGLLREEVRVQSDPVGRLVISGEPEQLDNPWGVTPFKKVVSLPSRIDPHQTSAVVTLHGQLFVRVPFEQSDL